MRCLCECGETLSNSQNPDIEYYVYSDKEWLDIAEDETITNSLLIPFPNHTAWLCPNCKRLHIWKNDSMERIALYELVVKKDAATDEKSQG